MKPHPQNIMEIVQITKKISGNFTNISGCTILKLIELSRINSVRSLIIFV